MDKNKVEELRDRVRCAAVLEQAGFAVDLKESTRRAVKYRRGDDIIIVIHEGKGWFDPLSDAKGDVFRLMEHLDKVGFVESLERISGLVAFVPCASPLWTHSGRNRDVYVAISERWRRRRVPWPNSMTWRYLRDERRLSEDVIKAALRHDRLREGPRGSMWAAHSNDKGGITGWEERGPEWRGFATGGSKELFRFGAAPALRLCITEAAIDAMSLADIEDMRHDSLFLSTGGGWSPAAAAAIRTLAARHGALLVAATDNDAQGEVYAARIMAVAAEAGCAFERLRPVAEDWNEDLRSMREEEARKGRSGTRLQPVRRRGHG